MSSKSSSIQTTVVDSAKRQINQAAAIAVDAATSRAWSYPLYGIFYLVSHPKLLQPLVPALLKASVLSVAVVATLFTVAYLPQVAVLAFISGPLAFIAAVPLVLGEAFVVVNFLARTFLLDRLNLDLFDSVLVEKGQVKLVEKSRQVQVSGGRVRQLGKALGKPLGRFNVDNIVRYVLTLPLNLVPVVGTALFLIYNGYKSGPAYHSRYFQLKSYDKSRRDSVIRQRRGMYTAFGFVATLLNLVPVASILFTCSTTVGAALLAADLEAKEISGK